MSAESLYVHDWDHWQTYRRDRGQPPWIKVHRCLMRDPKWIALTDAQRGQLVAIWLLAADRDGSIPALPDLIRKLCFIDGKLDVEVFISLGFIERRQCDASTAPIGRQHDAPEERRGETETEANVSVRVDDLWGVWIEELGGERPWPKLTPSRSQKLKALADEQLHCDDPLARFRSILVAVKASDHHMSKREYQMPESLFRSEDRRDTWAQKGINGNGHRPASGFHNPFPRPETYLP